MPKIETLIVENYPVNRRIQRVASMANSDLWAGPIYLTKEGQTTSMFDDDYDHAFDFSKACGIIGRWVNDNLPTGTVYLDMDSGEFMDSAPEGEEDEEGNWIEPYMECLYEIEPAEIRKALFGKELSAHI